MQWSVYSFECADADARETFLSWFDGTHPIDIPADADSVHGELRDADDGSVPADLAWIAEYVYVLTNGRVASLLDDSADLWERAVAADFDSETETCTEAALYRSEDDAPIEQVRYEGEDGLGGQGLVYRFAMEHQFRFRAYAHAPPPAPLLTEHFGAFEAMVGLTWGSDAAAFFEAETGVSPTARGVEFLENDPALAEGEFHEIDDPMADDR